MFPTLCKTICVVPNHNENLQLTVERGVNSNQGGTMGNSEVKQLFTWQTEL